MSFESKSDASNKDCLGTIPANVELSTANVNQWRDEWQASEKFVPQDTSHFGGEQKGTWGNQAASSCVEINGDFVGGSSSDFNNSMAELIKAGSMKMWGYMRG